MSKELKEMKEMKEMSQDELVKFIEDTKKGSLIDLYINEEVYWVSYINNESSYVVDTFIDSPKYFDSSLEAANYLSQISTHIR